KQASEQVGLSPARRAQGRRRCVGPASPPWGSEPLVAPAPARAVTSGGVAACSGLAAQTVGGGTAPAPPAPAVTSMCGRSIAARIVPATPRWSAACERRFTQAPGTGAPRAARLVLARAGMLDAGMANETPVILPALRAVVDSALEIGRRLTDGGKTIDDHQVHAERLAYAATEVRAAEALAEYAAARRAAGSPDDTTDLMA